MKSAKKTAKKILQPLYTAYHDYRYDRRYHTWLENSSKTTQAQRVDDLPRRPLISIVVPVYNTNEKFFREMVESVLAQSYGHWEIVLVDDNSPNPEVREYITEYAEKDKRIKYRFLPKNMGISGATNEAIKLSSGEFVALFDHDDVLFADALYEVAAAINRGNYDFIYTDEDKIMEGKRWRHQPFCKPAWNSDFLLSANYITHFTVIRKKLLDKVGYENGTYNGAQDWELFLRCTRALPEEKIYHIPKVLYSWRVHIGSTAKDLAIKPYVFEAQKRAIEDDLKAQGIDNARVLPDKTYPGQWQVKWEPIGTPKVSILVSSHMGESVCTEIKANTTYQNYETVPVNGGAVINELIRKIDSEYVVFVQERLVIKHMEWIQDMLGDAQRPDIGFVQARLKHQKDTAKNIESLLAPHEAILINSLTRRNVAKHLYTTARYNLPVIHGGVVMVEMAKLKKVLHNSTHIDVTKWSKGLHDQGHRNLYNPYVEVIK